MEGEKKVQHPSWGPPKIRLDPDTHDQVMAEVRRRIETGEQPRYQDVVRGLCRKALRDDLSMPPEHLEIDLIAAADVAQVGVGVLLSLRGEGAPVSRILPGGGRRYRLASLLRWMAADLRARRDAARAVQAELSDGVADG
jgi:hypothetical protein